MEGKEQWRIYLDGLVARAESVSFLANPYRCDDARALLWELGWGTGDQRLLRMRGDSSLSSDPSRAERPPTAS